MLKFFKSAIFLHKNPFFPSNPPKPPIFPVKSFDFRPRNRFSTAADASPISKVSRTGLVDAQNALFDYLHSTRSFHYTDAEHVSENSPAFLYALLSKVDGGEEDDVGRSVTRFLRYNPINESEPFFESLGLKPAELPPLLPRNVLLPQRRRRDARELPCPLQLRGPPEQDRQDVQRNGGGVPVRRRRAVVEDHADGDGFGDMETGMGTGMGIKINFRLYSGPDMSIVLPAQVRNMIYAASTSGRVNGISLEVLAFRMVWSYESGAPIFGSLSVVSSTGYVICCLVDGHVLALNSGGGVIWKVKIDGPIFAGPCISSALLYQVLICSRNGTVSSFDLEGGDVLWQYHIGREKNKTGNKFLDTSIS